MSIVNWHAKHRFLGSFASFFIAGALCGSIATANQIVNGNFSAGNVGFTSGYTLVPANETVQTAPGEIVLTTDPGAGFPNGYSSYTDHTGNAGGLMLLADGYYAGTNAWAETVLVAPSTTYTFKAWVASADSASVAVLGLFTNGSQFGSSFTAPATAGVWTEWTETLVTGAGVSNLVLSIQDLNPNPYSIGDDFTLDDLSLTGPAGTSGVPEPSTLTLVCLVLIACGAVKFGRFNLLKRAS